MMKKTKYNKKAISRMLMVFLIVIIIVIAGISSYFLLFKPAGKQTIKVGIIFPNTGAFSPFGQSATQGALLAIKDINRKGGIKGINITAVVGDSQSDPNVAVSEAERMITVERVDLVIGAYAASLAMAISQVCENYKVPYYEVIAAPNGLTLYRGAKYIFRFAPMGLDYGNISARFVVEYACPRMGWDPKQIKIAIVQEDSPWGESCSDGVETALQKYGVSPIARLRYSSKSTDLSSLIITLKALNPDVVFATSYTVDATLFIKQSSELGFRPKLFIGHSAGYETYATAEAVGDKIRGIFTVGFPLFAVNYSSLSPEVANERAIFLESFQSEYGKVPDHWAVLSYTAIYHVLRKVLEIAIDKYGGISPDNIRKAFLDVDVPDGNTFKIHGFKAYPPDHPNAGHNSRATLAPVCQWMNSSANGFVAVWPANLAVATPIIPPPINW